MLSVEAAQQRIVEAVEPVTPQRLPLLDCLQLTLYEDITSTTDSPPFEKSMMDGYAVRASDFSVAGNTVKVIGEVLAGAVSSQQVASETAIRIMTGAPVPVGADSVIPVELVRFDEATQTIEMTAAQIISPRQNIIARGSFLRAGEQVLATGRRIRAQEIALLAELGCAQPLVRRQAQVSLLATGDELVNVDEVPGPGQIRNSNALMLAAQVRQAGGVPHLLGIARDNLADLTSKVQTGLQSDFLCLSGGVSAGKLDLVPQVLAAAGVEISFHKIRMKPGKPLLFGVRRAGAGFNQCIVFGLPGNPVSSLVCFELFVRTALRRFQGISPAIPVTVSAVLKQNFSHRSDRPTWFPAKMRGRGEQRWVQPVNWQGSADLRSVADANCSLQLPEGDTFHSAGALLNVLPWGNCSGEELDD